MLSPHECVVRLGCSWTPQARQHAEVQDVDDSVAVEAGRDESRHSRGVLSFPQDFVIPAEAGI